jgi:ribosome maturation factor RimP
VIASERIAELVTPVLSETGHTLYDVEVSGPTVRVLIDGVSLEDLEKISPSVAASLEDIADEDERWFLEVSSPGLERPLRQPRHFQGAIGALVKIKTKSGIEGDRRVEDVLEVADESGVTIAGRRLRYDQIERARTVFKWESPAAVSPSPRQQPQPARSKSTKRSTP